MPTTDADAMPLTSDKSGPIPVHKSWKEIAVTWLFRQDLSTVLLVGILASLWYLGYYAMETAIPAHLDSIQNGYERIEASHSATSQAQSKHHADTIKLIMDTLRLMEIKREP